MSGCQAPPNKRALAPPSERAIHRSGPALLIGDAAFGRRAQARVTRPTYLTVPRADNSKLRIEN